MDKMISFRSVKMHILFLLAIPFSLYISLHSAEVLAVESQEGLYQKYFLNNKKASAEEVWNDFLSQPSGVTDIKRAEEVIVTLTSYPKRIGTAWLAIESLLRQIEKPDRIVLNLFEGEFPERVLPWMLEEQVKRGLEINWSSVNQKVYLKLRPTIIKYPNAHYVTCDDDLIYPSKSLGDLYKAHLESPSMVIARGVRIPKIVDDVIYPVKDWTLTNLQGSSKEEPPSRFNIPESVSMIFLPNKSINRDLFFDENLSSFIAPTDDDLWIYAAITANKVHIKKIQMEVANVVIENTSCVGLFEVNRMNDYFQLNRAYALLSKQSFMKDLLEGKALHSTLESCGQ